MGSLGLPPQGGLGAWAPGNLRIFGVLRCVLVHSEATRLAQAKLTGAQAQVGPGVDTPLLALTPLVPTCPTTLCPHWSVP